MQGELKRFADRLRLFRKAAGLTQTALAEKVGLRNTAIGNIEAGQCFPSFRTFEALVNALEIGAIYFFSEPATDLSAVMTRRSNYDETFESLARRVGRRVIDLRFERGFTQLEFAKRCGIQNSFLSKVESGKSKPSFKMLDRIATGLEVGLEDLFAFDSVEHIRFNK